MIATTPIPTTIITYNNKQLYIVLLYTLDSRISNFAKILHSLGLNYTRFYEHGLEMILSTESPDEEDLLDDTGETDGFAGTDIIEHFTAWMARNGKLVKDVAKRSKDLKEYNKLFNKHVYHVREEKFVLICH